MSAGTLCSNCVLVACETLCVDAALVIAGSRARVDSFGWPACELCGVRLNRVKYTHRHGPGHACHPRCKRPTGAAAAAPAACAAGAAPLTPRKRRAQSDPGELPAQAASVLTRRVTPPYPAPESQHKRVTRRDERIMRLLDETHARRMAAETAAAAAAATAAPAAVAAAAATAAAGEQGTTHTGFTVVFVP